MVCDWHPRSTTRPRAANAANSRRSLARRSMHPHPRPRPHLAPAYDSLFFLTPADSPLPLRLYPLHSTRLVPRALHFYLMLNFRSWPTYSYILKHRSLSTWVFRVFLHEIVKVYNKIWYNKVISHTRHIYIKFPFISKELFTFSARLLTYARIVPFKNFVFISVIYLLFEQIE